MYVLGSGPGSTGERARIKLNIGYGTVSLYIWRTVDLLASMAGEYVQWPLEEVRRQQRIARIDKVFGNCVGYLDGSEIALRDKPKNDHEAYFSRKKIYGFNLQVIDCSCESLNSSSTANVERQSLTLKDALFMHMLVIPPALMIPPHTKRLQFTKNEVAL